MQLVTPPRESAESATLGTRDAGPDSPAPAGQVHVGVDEPGQEARARQIHDLAARRRTERHLGDRALDRQDGAAADEEIMTPAMTGIKDLGISQECERRRHGAPV